MKKPVQIAAGILAAGILYTGYQIYAFRTDEVPLLDGERSKLDSSIKSKQAELKKLQSFAGRIEEIKKELKGLSINLDNALEYMPKTFNLPGLLRKLTLLSQNSGVELVTFRPKKNDEKVPGTFYATTGVDLDIKGSFTQTLVFLDQVSRMKRIINIDSLRIRGDETGSRSGQTGSSTSVSLRTYRFSE